MFMLEPVNLLLLLFPQLVMFMLKRCVCCMPLYATGIFPVILPGKLSRPAAPCSHYYHIIHRLKSKCFALQFDGASLAMLLAVTWCRQIKRPRKGLLESAAAFKTLSTAAFAIVVFASSLLRELDKEPVPSGM